MSDGGGLQKKQKKFEQKAAKEAKTSKWARASLLSKKSSKKGLTRRPLFLVRVESLVCTVEMIGPSRAAPPAPGCAPARPALHVSTLLFAASANHSCAIGAEALSHQLLLFLSLHLLWTCGGGSRGSASLPVATASANRSATQGFFAEMQSIRPRSGSNPRLLIISKVLAL